MIAVVNKIADVSPKWTHKNLEISTVGVTKIWMIIVAIAIG